MLQPQLRTLVETGAVETPAATEPELLATATLSVPRPEPPPASAPTPTTPLVTYYIGAESSRRQQHGTRQEVVWKPQEPAGSQLAPLMEELVPVQMPEPPRSQDRPPPAPPRQAAVAKTPAEAWALAHP